MSRQSRRKVIKGIGSAALVGLTGCMGSGGNTGPSGTSRPYNVGFVNMQLAGDPWLQSFHNGVKWYAQDHDHIEARLTHGEGSAQKQVTRSLDLLRQGVDALIVSPISSEGLVKVVEEAKSRDVPVFTANTTAAMGDIKLFTAFGNDTAASVCGDTIVNRLEERHGAPKGRVIEVMMPQETRTFTQRHEGFVQRIEQEDDIEIVQSVRVDQASTADVTQKLTPVLRRTKNLDAIYCPDFNTGLGVTSALENVGMKAKVGNEGHVITSCIDASNSVLNQINNGYIDTAVDQPNLFYGPLTLHYITKYLDADKDDSVLPKPGNEVTADDLTIDGSKHLGVDPWSEPIWATANVQAIEFDDGKQTQLSTREIVISQDSNLIDAPYIWGNLSQKY